MNKLKLPFTDNMNGGKKSFKILNENQIMNNPSILNIIQKMFETTPETQSSAKYIKASTTKQYYKKINSKKIK